MDRCQQEKPPTFELADGHTARCWLYADKPAPSAPERPDAQ